VPAFRVRSALRQPLGRQLMEADFTGADLTGFRSRMRMWNQPYSATFKASAGREGPTERQAQRWKFEFKMLSQDSGRICTFRRINSGCCAGGLSFPVLRTPNRASMIVAAAVNLLNLLPPAFCCAWFPWERPRRRS